MNILVEKHVTKDNVQALLSEALTTDLQVGDKVVVLSETITNDLKPGDKVTVVQDATYPFDARPGVILELEGGFALVDFGNNYKARCLRNLLLKLPA